MPNRKKARGRQNRAKKEVTRQRTLWEPTILRNNSASNIATCEHTLAVLPRIPQEGPAISYMNCLAGEGFFDKATHSTGNDPVDVCFRPLMRFPEVWTVESERSLAMNLLLRFVRSAFLCDSAIEGENWFHSRAQNEVSICISIHSLELLGTYSDLAVAKRRADKMVHRLVFGNRRGDVKFVAKRLPCACLKELHRAARTKVAKVTGCIYCQKPFPRSQMCVCSGCMITEYCSKECQRADWKDHKQFCGNPEVMSRDLPSDYILIDR